MADRDPETGQFVVGHTGMGGRPQGSRNKLGEAFLEALHEDFQAHGKSAIEQCRTEKPDAYVRVIAGLLPSEVKVTTTSDLTDEQLDARIRQLAAALELEVGIRGPSSGTTEAPTAH